MSGPALYALADPAQVPAAAAARLSETAAALLAESNLSWASLYASLLSTLSAVASKAALLLPLAAADTASERQLAGLDNAARLARAASNLFGIEARRASGRPKAAAMRWATLCRRLHADVALTLREHAYGAYIGTAWATAAETAPVRVLPGAAEAMAELAQDPVLVGDTWDIETLAATLAHYVAVAA